MESIHPPVPVQKHRQKPQRARKFTTVTRVPRSYASSEPPDSSSEESDISMHTARRTSPPMAAATEAQDNIPLQAMPPSKLMDALLDLFLFYNPQGDEYRFLPFLRRNVRQGFTSRSGRGQVIDPKPVNILVVYLLPGSSELRWTGVITEYLCPVCTLFNGLFKNRDMLAQHIQDDHQEISSHWQREGDSQWTLTITFPPPPKQESPSPHLSTTELYHPQPRHGADSVSNVMVKLRQESESPGHLEFLPDSSYSPPPSKRPPHLPVTPPPASSSLGPSAEPPYLPAFPITSNNIDKNKGDQYMGQPVYYTCRPGGPKIYDLLGTLPMSQFGIMEWEIIDREEELFECDDITDEGKVVAALWNRWYYLKGSGHDPNSSFRQNRLEGVRSFIHYYWRMIHRAAGWEALRNWLLVLQTYRLLTIADVAKALKEYEGLTKMEEWYTEESEDGTD